MTPSKAVCIYLLLSLSLLLQATFQSPDSSSCPAGTCPDGYSCCALSEQGQYGCCPFYAAVCCNDKLHCCPQHYHCGETCLKSTLKNYLIEGLLNEVPLKELLVVKQEERVQDICPVGTCGTLETCCDLGDGTYACCGLPDAVCCSDHLHCCPQGYTCDLTNNICLPASKSTSNPPVLFFNESSQSLLKKAHPKPSNGEVTSLTEENNSTAAADCPTGTCPVGETCCSRSGFQYGCCAMPSAVCCSDGVHCCPEGYTCNIKQGECDPAKQLSQEKVPLRPLAGSTTISPTLTSCEQCQSGTTCCPTASGSYGCCVYPLATCCPDLVNCCPNSYICTSEGCIHESLKHLSFNFTSPKKF